MRRILAITILYTLTSITTGFCNPRDWFPLKAEGFEILFPAKPVKDIKTIPTRIGDLKADTHIYDASKADQKDENLVYGLIVADFPDSILSSDRKDLSVLFRNAIDGGVKNVGGRLVSETEFEFAGFPGREVKIELEKGTAYAKSWNIIVKNRLYAVMVITLADNFPNESMDKFFNSFKVNTLNSPKEWYPFKSEGYSIEFPVKPTIETSKVPSPIGELTLINSMYDAQKTGDKNDNLAYSVIVTDYPDSLIHSDNKEMLPAFFRNSIDGGVANSGGTLSSEKEIEIGGYPGREARVDLNEGKGVLIIRCYLVKNRFYILQTITEKPKFPNNSVDRFLGSFRLAPAN